MNKSDYDKYYKKGGTYVISVEIFNELFEEIERLNNIINELAFIFDDYNEFNEILKKYNYELKGNE